MNRGGSAFDHVGPAPLSRPLEATMLGYQAGAIPERVSFAPAAERALIATHTMPFRERTVKRAFARRDRKAAKVGQRSISGGPSATGQNCNLGGARDPGKSANRIRFTIAC